MSQFSSTFPILFYPLADPSSVSLHRVSISDSGIWGVTQEGKRCLYDPTVKDGSGWKTFADYDVTDVQALSDGRGVVLTSGGAVLLWESNNSYQLIRKSLRDTHICQMTAYYDFIYGVDSAGQPWWAEIDWAGEDSSIKPFKKFGVGNPEFRYISCFWPCAAVGVTKAAPHTLWSCSNDSLRWTKLDSTYPTFSQVSCGGPNAKTPHVFGVHDGIVAYIPGDKPDWVCGTAPMSYVSLESYEHDRLATLDMDGNVYLTASGGTCGPANYFNIQGSDDYYLSGDGKFPEWISSGGAPKHAWEIVAFEPAGTTADNQKQYRISLRHLSSDSWVPAAASVDESGVAPLTYGPWANQPDVFRLIMTDGKEYSGTESFQGRLVHEKTGFMLSGTGASGTGQAECLPAGTPHTDSLIWFTPRKADS